MTLETKLSGGEPFRSSGVETGHSVLDFWRWAYSDLNANVIRGAFAEYIVAVGLGMPLDRPRVPWDDVDLKADGMPSIEVKASAYVQSWDQEKPSTINFRYPATVRNPGPDAAGKSRPSEVYVFCLYTPVRREDVDMLNFDLWKFYVVPTKTLNERARSQTDITLPSLERIASGVGFSGLKNEFVRLGLI